MISGASSRAARSSSWSTYCPITRVGVPRCLPTSSITTSVLESAVEASRYFTSGSATAYVIRSASVSATRTSMQSAGAM